MKYNNSEYDTLPASAITLTYPGSDKQTLGALSLSASATTVTVNGTTEQTVTLTPTATDTEGDSYPTDGVTYTFDAGSTGATISGNIITIPAKATAGTITVAASLEGKTSDDVTINVTRGESVPTTVTISGAESVTVPCANDPGHTPGNPVAPATEQYTATVTDQYGNTVENPGVTWNAEITPADSGVTFTDGVLTVADGAAPNGDVTVTIKATAGTVTGAKTVNVVRDRSVFNIEIVDEDNKVGGMTPAGGYTITIPSTGSNTLTLYARGDDKYGNEIDKPYTVTCGGTLPANMYSVSGNQITITVPADTDPGTYDLTAKIGEKSKTTTIEVANKTPVTVDMDGVTLTDKEYDGEPVTKPTSGAVAKDKNTATEVTVDSITYEWYTVDGKKMDTDPENAGTYKLVATVVDDQYTGSGEKQFTITKKAVTVSGITAADKVYNGDTDVVLSYNDASIAGKIGQDDLIVTSAVGAFADKNVGTDKQVDIAAITLGGADAGNYQLSAEGNQTTATADITALEATLVWSGYTDLTYGDTVNVTAKVGNLVGEDICTVTVTGGNETNAGTYTATAESLSNANYKLPDAASQQYTIAPKVTTFNVTLEPDSFVYNSSNQKPATVTVKDGETELTAGDYTVTFPAVSTDYGTYTVTVDGKGNYAGSSGSATYQITKQQQSALTISGAEDKTYGGAAFEITVSGGSGTGAYSLTSSDSEVLSLTANDDTTWTATILKAGTVTLTATKAGGENYEDAKAEVKVTINSKDINNTTVTLKKDSFEYTGDAIEPTVTIKDGQDTLTEGTDYEVEYSGDCINVGTATVTVVGKGNYTGEVQKPFTITAKDISTTAEISGLAAEYPYTGTAIIPDFSVRDGSKTLEKGADYDVAYSTRTGLGKVIVTVTFKGNYTGEIEKTFTIVPGTAEGNVTITADTTKIEVGTTLTANVTGDKLHNITYQWYRNGEAISGATGNKYTLVEADAAAMVSVWVTSTGNYEGTLKSQPVEVGKMSLPGTLTIAGGTAVGDKLTATMTSGVDAANYTIVWLRNGVEISGATGTQYTITTADKGTVITAKAVAKAGTQYTGTVTANNTISIPATVPSAPVVTAIAGDGRVTIQWTVADNGGSPITKYILKANDKNAVELNAPAGSYTFTGLTNGTKYTFTVQAVNAIGASAAGNAEATPVATNWGGGTVSGDYIVSVDRVTGGRVTVTPGRADKGDTVTITVKPDTGYVLEDLIVTDSKGNTIRVTEKDDNKYTFKMPDSKVSIEPVFVKEGEEKPVEPAVPFADVSENDWFYEAVQYAYDNELMNGTSAVTFGPYENMSRAMIWTVLARLEGKDTTTGNTWYQVGMNWAMEHGISDGSDPNGAITREQLCAMLYRYMGSPEVTGEITGFADAASISSWAEDAMLWAIDNGFIGGMGDGTVVPQGTANRAQVATILMRFIEASK